MPANRLPPTSQTDAAAAIYLNPSPTITGQFSFKTADGRWLDSTGGPRDSMIRIYLASGYDVRDERGCAVTR